MENGLYARVAEERLREVLQTLQAYTDIPVQLLDSDGSLLQAFGKPMGYCALLQKGVFSPASCQERHRKAGYRALTLGEAYIFSCPANLNHIAFPLCVDTELLGSVILGPFLMDTPDSTLVSALAEQNALSPSLSLELYDELIAIPVVPPPRVQLLKKMMDFMLSPLIPEERALLRQSQEKLYQQSRINETIQQYKGKEESASSQFFYEKETELLRTVRTGHISEVKGLINELIGYALFSQGGDMTAIRVRSIELATLLSRVALEGGAKADSVYALNTKLLPALYQEQNLDELCLRIQEIAEHFMTAMFYEQDKGNLYIRRALRYMADHYSEPLTLSQVAQQVNLSPGYFSTLFGQVVGQSFREQLCRIRIEESRRLMLSTDYALADIAVAVGFPDQSYFCKAFKRIVGCTPGKFRA